MAFQDLESPNVSHICLGLEALIRSPIEDAIPAVQDRVYDLLAHNSSVCKCVHAS